jgi:spermidine synthase
VTGERTRSNVRLLTAFVIGLVTLTLEIAYTRVISFKLFYYYTYFVIGLALLGLGASSAVVALSSRLRAMDTVRLIRLAGPSAGLVGVLGYVVAARLPTDVNLIWAGSGGQAVGQLTRLFLLSVALTAVFFTAGLIMASLFVVEVSNVRRLYFWDLTGAALGCLAAVPLQATIGPPAMILVAVVLLALLGPLGAAVTDRRFLLGGLAVVVVAGGAFAAGQLKIRADATKTLQDGDTIAAGDWGAVFRVDAVDVGNLSGAGEHHILHHDGLWGSAIWRYDGTPATTARFGEDSRQIPFAAAPNDAPSLLIIGAAGGNEIQAALTYGVGRVDAVELNPVTVDLLEGPFADYTGNITDDPRVNYVQGDGRTFLARSDTQYDLIWFVAPDSYAAANAATSGAFVLSESYLYTEEMIDEAFDHLTSEGVMVAQFGDFDFDTRPTRTARYLVTARQALADELGDDFAAHTALVVERSELEVGRASTILLARQPIDAATSGRVADSVANVPRARLLHRPGGDTEAGLIGDLIVGTDDEVARLVDEYAYDISAIDDGRPFFWHFTPFSSVLTNWERSYEDSEIAIGERLLIVLVAVATVIAAVLLWLPFAVTRRRRAAAPVRSRWRFFVYFASLGLGFMLIEISMIQRFALLLGFPTLSLSVSLFTLLIATAVGARTSGLVTRLRGGLPAVTALLIVIAAVYLLVAAPVTDAALAWPQWARIALVIVLLFPVGLLLGMYLPTGMEAVAAATSHPGQDRGRLVAWSWAVNGFFSVLGASLTTLISMSFGFNRAVLAGLVLYVVATTVLWTARDRRPVVEQTVEVQPGEPALVP